MSDRKSAFNRLSWLFSEMANVLAQGGTFHDVPGLAVEAHGLGSSVGWHPAPVEYHVCWQTSDGGDGHDPYSDLKKHPDWCRLELFVLRGGPYGGLLFLPLRAQTFGGELLALVDDEALDNAKAKAITMLERWGRFAGQRACEVEEAHETEDDIAGTVEAEAETANQPPLDARALAVFITHPDWTKIKIAEELGCNEKSLSPVRCPKLAAAIAASKSRIDPSRRQLSGGIEDGKLEAWER